MSFLGKNKYSVQVYCVYLFLLFIISSCSTQKKINVQYLNQRFSKTGNKSFLNNELILLKGKDTMRINVKIPYNSVTSDTINNGILYRCFFKPGKIYTLKLKRISVDSIPDAVNSYYKINTIASGKKKSTFKEIKKDTEFIYRNPGKYVDIDNKIYEVRSFWPDIDCAFE